jgi:hypothetical protein
MNPESMESPASGVHIRTCRAAAGMAWLRGALRLFGRQPIPMVMLIALGPLLSLSLALVPLLGQGLGLLLFPMILLGLLTVCRSADQGLVPGISSYTAGLRDATVRLRLLQIGVVYALIVGLVGLAWTLVPDEAETRPKAPSAAITQHPVPAQAPRTAPDTPQAEGIPGARPSAAPAPGRPVEPATGSDVSTNPDELPSVSLTPTRLFIILATLLISIPLQITVLFATTLVAWHGLPVVKALFFAFFAGWRNRTPILINLFGLIGLAFVCLLGLAALIALLGLSEETAQVLLGPVILLLLPIGAASSYAMIRDVIAENGGLPEGPAARQSGPL